MPDNPIAPEDQENDPAVSAAEPAAEEASEKKNSSAPVAESSVSPEKTNEQLIAECEDYRVGWQRALADYRNLQKEMTVRRAEWASLSEQQILEEFIPVYDNFKKAFVHQPALDNTAEEGKKLKNWIDGIGFIMKQFGEILRQHGVEEIKTVGQRFDPVFHEAVGEAAADGKESGAILQEADGGYTMGGRVVKVAKVIVVR